jgi:hypothetical protein
MLSRLKYDGGKLDRPYNSTLVKLSGMTCSWIAKGRLLVVGHEVGLCMAVHGCGVPGEGGFLREHECWGPCVEQNQYKQGDSMLVDRLNSFKKSALNIFAK